jgi:hypothetical protein
MDDIKNESLKKLLELLQFDNRDTIYLRDKKIDEKIINFASNKGYIYGTIDSSRKDPKNNSNYIINYSIKSKGYEILVKINTIESIKLLKKTTQDLSKETSQINKQMLRYTKWLLYLTIALFIISIINIIILLY